MNIKLKGRSPYLAKDQVKADDCNKFIGQGSSVSSTNSYRLSYGVLANCGEYKPNDVVFVSAEGNRRGRLEPPYEELKIACKAEVTFITDILLHRNRQYNVGEREVATFLETQGYWEVDSYGLWQPPSKFIKAY